MGCKAGNPDIAWKEILRPYALGLVGLAIAVTLWGFGYKLSLYLVHPAPSVRASVAKFWVEPRNGCLAAVSALKANSHLTAGSPAIPASIQGFPHFDGAVAWALPERTHRPASFNFLIPFRSPPPQNFLPA
ncbi:MAG: hypothetical protein WBE72_09265 [Terracidiphilus sp.]